MRARPSVSVAGTALTAVMIAAFAWADIAPASMRPFNFSTSAAGSPARACSGARLTVVPVAP